MSASASVHTYTPREGRSLHVARIVVFGSIGILYVLSLFVPPLREVLAKLFSLSPW